MNLEDKIVQRGVAMLLEPIYEREFYDFSHGFRRERNAHQALQSLRDQIMEMKGVWLVDADIRGYFDHVPRGPLREVLKRRVNDGGILRLIGKWLHAGVLEGDKVHHPETGVPQGGVISPLLSNIYLHVVLDEWFVEKVQPRLQGRAFLIRFADDCVPREHTLAAVRQPIGALPHRR
jgi:retron-type reverse transcriptase